MLIQNSETTQKSLRTISIKTPEFILFSASLWLVIFLNIPFWRDIFTHTDASKDSIAFILSLPIVVVLWIYLLLNLLCWSHLTKLILGSILLISAAISYFISVYGIVFDYDMFVNVLQTDSHEAMELVEARLLIWLVAIGILPCIVIRKIPLVQRAWRDALLAKLTHTALAAILLAGIVFANYQSYASLLRNHRELSGLLVPSNVVGTIQGHLKRLLKAPAEYQTVGTDAHQQINAINNKKHDLMILVIGETARAANFSLNGYSRLTNPQLTSNNVVSFTQVSSCGTATAISLPCMFLDLGRDNYKEKFAYHRDGLLNVLQRAGIDVIWSDNNSGCKGVCDRVPHKNLSAKEQKKLCHDDNCFDEVLLYGLQDHINTLKKDGVIVLHMKGSHGPAYFKRYPKTFEKFTPVCASTELDRCPQESIVNAYDNSLLYTDYVLSKVIHLLTQNSARFNTSMLYVSDHGESLGEHSIYLHGLPYSIAPSAQKHIPMILWLSQDIAKTSGITTDCMATYKNKPLSHDNLFHSVLGLMRVQTSAYKPEMDFFKPCLDTETILAAGNATEKTN